MMLSTLDVARQQTAKFHYVPIIFLTYSKCLRNFWDKGQKDLLYNGDTGIAAAW